MFMSQIDMLPAGGMVALTLTSWKFAFALAANFLLGALLTLGIGSYAPSLIILAPLFGMDPRAAFPIMMGSAAMMAMVAGLRFMKAGRFDATGRARPDPRRNPRCAAGRARRAIPAPGCASVGRRRCCRLCGDDDAAVCLRAKLEVTSLARAT